MMDNMLRYKDFIVRNGRCEKRKQENKTDWEKYKFLDFTMILL